MNDKKELRFIMPLKYFGVIKTYNVSKSEMCKKAQSICSHNCDSCAWKEGE